MGRVADLQALLAEAFAGAPQPPAELAAHALVAELDGALLLRHLAGPAAGERAATALGWR